MQHPAHSRVVACYITRKAKSSLTAFGTSLDDALAQYDARGARDLREGDLGGLNSCEILIPGRTQTAR